MSGVLDNDTTNCPTIWCHNTSRGFNIAEEVRSHLCRSYQATCLFSEQMSSQQSEDLMELRLTKFSFQALEQTSPVGT